MSGFAFAIIAPAFYAISNLFDRFIAEKQIKNNPGVLTIFAASASLLTGILVLAIIRFPIFSAGQTALILLAGILSGIGLLPYYAIISVEDASRVVPYLQLIPVMVLSLSYIFLHESLSSHELLGFVGIVGGAFVLSIKKFDRHLFRLHRALGYMAITDLCIATSVVIFRFVVIHESFWPSFGYDFLGEGLGGVLLLIIPRYRLGSLALFKKISAGLWFNIAGDQIFYSLGRFFTFQAIALIPVALVSSLNGFQSLYTLIFGLILTVWFPSIIKEDIRRSTIAVKLAAIILIFIGVWLVYF